VVTLSPEGFPDMRGNRPYYVLLLYPSTCHTSEVKVNLIRSSRKLLRTILFVEFARLDTGSIDLPADFQQFTAKATGDFGQPSAGKSAFPSCRTWAFPHTS
jgi:hypothetical protein